MNDENHGGFLSRVVIWGLVGVIMLLWMGILFAPAFLPLIRKELDRKYDKFRFKDRLIQEEMNHYTLWSLIICITGWFATIAYLLFVGL